jgi:tripartite-type tricarboxylate transporter receptor subunit TctC
MLISRVFSGLGVLVLAPGVFGADAAATASERDFPARTIRIVTTEPGSTSDFLARQIAQGLTAVLGRQVIVENRAGGMVASELVRRASADGYTMLLNGSSLWLSPLMRDNVAYDPVRDYAPVTVVASAPNILVVHPSVAAGSVAELIALAKSKPGELNYGSGSTGAPSHLASELFKSMAGVNIVRIPYKGTSPAVNALMGGQVQMMFVSPLAVMPLAKTGKLRALAVSTPKPSTLAPGLPTVTSAGLPGYESQSVYGLLAPARTPAMLISRLNRESVRTLNAAELRERLLATGVEAAGSTPQELTATIKSEMVKWGKVIKAARIREE